MSRRYAVLRQVARTRRTLRGTPDYLRHDLRRDAVAGLTVAVMGVPQAMGYAIIAGLPPVYGLYTSIVCCGVAALSGSSRHLVTGPTNALSMVILSLTAHLPAKYPGVGVFECALLLTLMTGLVQVAFGLLRMGGIVRYVSNSVVVGFTAGAGILIAGNQIKNVLGVQIEGHAERFHEVLWLTFSKLPETNFHALGIAVFTGLCVVGLPRLNRRIPGALVGVLVSAAVTGVLGWHLPAMGGERVRIVADVGMIERSLAMFHVPSLLTHPNYELTRELGTGAVALALLGLIEAASIGRAVAASSGQRLDFNREFVGQGLGNVAGAFFQNFAGSGSFTRTAVNYQSGARTRMAAVWSALWTALTILLFAPAANYIPIAALAGMLVVIAYSMIEKHRLRLAFRAGSNSRVVLLGTLVSTLIFPLEYAVFIGVGLSIFFLLKVTGRTDLTQLVPRADAGFDEVPFNRAPESPVVTINIEGDLYFAAVEDLEYELQRAIGPRTRVVVLRMKRLRAVGSTAMAILEHFSTILRSMDLHLVVCGIEEKLSEVMTRSGLRDRIGEANIFYADNKLFQSTELALARAMSIVEMERRRDEAARARQSSVAPQVGARLARDIMTRNAVRFGHQHQLREAVWLLSEMNKRAGPNQHRSLYLQDREGRLAGKLSSYRLFEAMTEGMPPSEGREPPSDAELARAFAANMTRSIEPLARLELPRLGADAPLGRLLAAAFLEDLRVLPVLDEGRRIVGLIGEDEFLLALGDALEIGSAEEELLGGGGD